MPCQVEATESRRAERKASLEAANSDAFSCVDLVWCEKLSKRGAPRSRLSNNKVRRRSTSTELRRIECVCRRAHRLRNRAKQSKIESYEKREGGGARDEANNTKKRENTSVYRRRTKETKLCLRSDSSRSWPRRVPKGFERFYQKSGDATRANKIKRHAEMTPCLGSPTQGFPALCARRMKSFFFGWVSRSPGISSQSTIARSPSFCCGIDEHTKSTRELLLCRPASKGTSKDGGL